MYGAFYDISSTMLKKSMELRRRESWVARTEADDTPPVAPPSLPFILWIMTHEMCNEFTDPSTILPEYRISRVHMTL